MSGGNDNLFARWSRRKLSVPSDETQTDTDTQQIDEQAAAHAGPDCASPPLDSAEPDAVEAETADTAEPLPRLEDLTAESDFTAFLKKGVPPALKSAALRKMWSLDPGIRDYVGPSEYAWDFNQPGSMAGFGSIKTKETVVGFLSKTARALEPETEPASTAQPPDASPDGPANAPTEIAADAEAPEPSMVVERPEADPVAANADAISREPEASPETTKHSQASEPAARPRHGGAMPR